MGSQGMAGAFRYGAVGPVMVRRVSASYASARCGRRGEVWLSGVRWGGVSYGVAKLTNQRKDSISG